MSIHTGKVRLFVYKENNKSFEIGRSDIWEDGLISDVDYNHSADIISEEVANCGWDLFDQEIQDILEEYVDSSIVEIVADISLEYFTVSHFHFEGDEVDLEAHLLNIQHRQLTRGQIERFAPDLMGDK